MGYKPHLYLKPTWPGERIPLSAAAIHHLDVVLRMVAGDRVAYTDGRGNRGSGVLADGFVVRGAERYVPRPSPALRIAVAPPRSASRQRFVVEKLSELGVDALLWLDTGRSEGRPPRPAKAHTWAVAALQQSRGTWLMDVSGPLALEDMLRQDMLKATSSAAAVGSTGRACGAHSGGDLRWTWVAEPGSDASPELSSFADCGDLITVAIGPEGGWAPGELPPGRRRFSLGPTVLRTETAAVAAAVAVLGRTRWLNPGEGSPSGTSLQAAESGLPSENSA
ncbi:MAG: RsmE family RNA methyltransferase [Acidimicrobiia bacterium]